MLQESSSCVLKDKNDMIKSFVMRIKISIKHMEK